MVKAVFLDFYGTVMYEDGEIIKKITEIIAETGSVDDKSKVGTFWWNEFQTMFTSSYGAAFETQRALEYHRLQPTGAFTSEDAKSYKPRKELFQLALQSTGLKGNEVVHIGDSLSSDVKGAGALGINTIWLNRSRKEIPDGVLAIENLLSAYDTEYFK